MAAGRLPATRGPGSYWNDGGRSKVRTEVKTPDGCASVRSGDDGLCADASRLNTVRALRASVAAGESGPVIMLSGEADIASAVQLTALISGQLNAGALHLTINASGLSYVDSMAVQVLVVAAKILRARGGGLVLFRPQRQVARTLTLMGADQMITIRGGAEATSGPGGTQD